MKRGSRFQKYILPGLIFQSLVISGGYGTGAELNHFFLSRGPVGALLGLAVTFVVWALVCAVTFEFARVFRAYNYKSAFERLLGRGWVLYELCYIVMLVLVLAVLTATAGIAARSLFGAPEWVGTAAVSACIIALVLGGTAAVERFLSYWSYVLYAVYAVFLAVCFARFGGSITYHLTQAPLALEGWASGGARYAFYNLGMIPAVLFSVRHAETRREAVGAGVIAAAIGIVPALLLVLAMSGLYPAITQFEAPVTAIFSVLDTPLLAFAFQLVLFGTLVETGAGLIKAVSDRFESSYLARARPAPYWLRPLVTTTCVCAGIGISTLGLTSLIDRGYGTLSWFFLAVFVVPMLTLGVWKIRRCRRK